MRMKSLLLPFAMLWVLPTTAQISIENLKDHPSLKTATLHVQLGDTLSPYAKEVMAMFRKEWTGGPVRFLGTGEPPAALMTHGTYFLSAVRSHFESSVMRETRDAFTGAQTVYTKGSTITRDYFYIALWTPKKDFRPKSDLEEKQEVIVRAELFLKSIIMGGQIEYSDLGISTTTFPKDFLNGSLGRLRNTMQFINTEVQAGRELVWKKDLKPSPELKRLKKETLYFPDYWTGPGTAMEGMADIGGRNAKYLASLTEGYAHPVKIITLPELEERLKDQEDILNLSYVQSSVSKMLSVVNARIGDVLYCTTSMTA